MNFVSLFSGIGGFDLGFERAGMTCIAQVENNAHANQILAKHWPDVARYEDVKHVGRNNLPANVDVLCGGFPCQDVSVAGKRAGLAGERSGLWFEFLRILTELAPRIVVIENVPGLLSSNAGADFAVILQGLVERGYRVCWRVLDAQYFGVAQRRRRVFLVASLGDGRSAEILFERESGTGNIEESKRPGQGVADAISGSAATTGVFGQTGRGYWQPGVQTLKHRDFKDAGNVVVGTLTPGAHPGGYNGQDAYTGHLIAGTLGKEMGRNRGLDQENEIDLIVPVNTSWDSQCRRIHDISGIAPTLSNEDGRGQGVPLIALHAKNGQDISPALMGEGHDSGEDGLGRHAFALSSMGVRRLTPLECERLQGFPVHWTEGLSDSARYQRLGNAVCVSVAEWLGHRLMQYVLEQRQQEVRA